jgi:hypothetical protein
MIGSILGPAIAAKIGLKLSFFVGGLSLSLCTFSLIFPAYYSQNVKI